MLLSSLLIVGALALYFMNADERARLARPIAHWLRIGIGFARRVRVSYFLVTVSELAVAALIVGAATVSEQAMAEIRPVMAHVLDVETRISSEYDAAVERFTSGRLSSRALAALIEQRVAPELAAAGERLRALPSVPAEHRAMVAAAETYLRLRQESWQLRVTALRKGNDALLRDAEAVERASLDALAVLRRGA